MLIPLARKGLLALLVFVIALLPALTTQAKDQQAALDFVMGNFEFVLLHEIAHLIIAEKQIPIIGPVENAADYIATTILVRGENFDVDDPEALRRFAHSAADAFSSSWQKSSERKRAVPYWDNHSLDIQRYYTVLCLLYGSAPNEQNNILMSEALPEQRAAGCPVEYEMALRGVKWMIATYGKGKDDPPGAKARYEYVAPRSLRQQAIVEEIRRINLLELTLDAFTDTFHFEKPLLASIRSCGSPNAAWQAERRELVICYELLEAFYALYE